MDVCQGMRRVIIHNDSSVIDYVLLLRCFVHLGSRLAVIPNIESKHMPRPVELELSLTNNIDVFVGTAEKSKNSKVHVGYRKGTSLLYMFFTEEISSLFTHATELIEVDVEAAIKIFGNGVKLAGDCMKRIVIIGNISENPWFDNEYAEKR